MIKMRYLGRAALLSTVVLVVGCTTAPESDSSLGNGGDHIYPTDLKTVINHLVDELLASHAVAKSHPQVAFAEVKDKTSNHIDAQAFSSQIRDQLTKSGKVRLVADSAPDNSATRVVGGKIVHYKENGHPPVHRFAKLTASSYRLLGIIADSPAGKSSNAAKGQYYRATLSLLDVDSGELIWIDEQENVGRLPAR